MDSKSDFTQEAHEARVEALKKRFAYQFQGPNIGHHIEPGWLDLVEQACIEIDRQIPASEQKTFWWDQIKEKFGGLRMYYANGPVRVDIHEPERMVSMKLGEDRSGAISEIIARAEASSFQTCAVCGGVGKRRTDRGWVRTLCDEHAKKK